MNISNLIFHKHLPSLYSKLSLSLCLDQLRFSHSLFSPFTHKGTPINIKGLILNALFTATLLTSSRQNLLIQLPIKAEHPPISWSYWKPTHYAWHWCFSSSSNSILTQIRVHIKHKPILFLIKISSFLKQFFRLQFLDS